MSAATSATTSLPAGAVHVGPWEKSPQDGARFRLCLCGIYPAVPGASNGPTAYVSAMQFDDSDGFVSYGVGIQAGRGCDSRHLLDAEAEALGHAILRAAARVRELEAAKDVV